MTRKPTILVVDDDGPILLLMRNILREFGFDALGASNGSEALALAREHRPNLVLLDKHMPGMDGEEVIRRLRREPGLGEVPILILSGEPVEPDDRRSSVNSRPEAGASVERRRPHRLVHQASQWPGLLFAAEI